MLDFPLQDRVGLNANGVVTTFFLQHSVQPRVGKGGIATKELGDAQVAIPIDPKLLSPWPIARLPNWVARVNEPLSEQELDAVRRCVRRGSPLGDASWVKTTARRLALESTLSAGGRCDLRVSWPCPGVCRAWVGQ